MYRAQIHISRPGALTKFLDSLGAGWNVSLFHYRNHGADIGRVLVGLQVPPEELPKLHEKIRNQSSSYTVAKLRTLSRRFRRENRKQWAAFCAQAGDYGQVVVTQQWAAVVGLSCGSCQVAI